MKIKVISGYCSKHTVCADCPLQGDDRCKLKVNPIVDWYVSERLRNRKENKNDSS